MSFNYNSYVGFAEREINEYIKNENLNKTCSSQFKTTFPCALNLSGITFLYQSVASTCNFMNSSANPTAFTKRPELLDDALTISSCFSALQAAVGDKLSYVLVDDYARLLAVIAHDLQFPYFIVSRNTSIDSFTQVLTDLVISYCKLYCSCKCRTVGEL